MSLFKNIRFYVLLCSVLFSVGVYIWITTTVISVPLQRIRLEQIYALTAITFLYLALLAGPLCFTFRFLPFRGHYIKARRAIGVSAFYFGLLHALIAFFWQLGGFEGLFFLSTNYVIGISLSFTALIIFSVMAATSFDYMIVKLTFPRWKFLHRFVYIAAIFILIHAVMLGTNFQDLNALIPQTLFIATAFLLFLELLRVDAFFKRKFPNTSLMSFLSMPLFVLLILAVIYFILPTPQVGNVSFGIHSQHILLAQQAQQSQQSQVANTQNIPGLNGDRTKRYSTEMIVDQKNPQGNQDVIIKFDINDASNGEKIKYFRVLYEKLMHLIIVNNDLTYFSHIHPVLNGDEFSITTQFPKDDVYHLYITFQPFGGIEQQFAFVLPIGNLASSIATNPLPETGTKTFGDYSVSIDTHGALTASQMSQGLQKISFTLKDIKTGQPVKNLKPYLGAFGHLTMIKTDSFDFIHVHPYNLLVPKSNENGGPTVDFLPIGIYGSFKPGMYKAFAEFNPDGKLFTADFIIKID